MARSPAAADRGNVTAYFLVMFLPMIFAVGLVLDGGRKVEALGQARDLADNAARIAVQSVDPLDPDRTIDQARAATQIDAYLGSAGSNVSLVSLNYPTVSSVEVTVAVSVDYLILPGPDTVEADGAANPAIDQ